MKIKKLTLVLLTVIMLLFTSTLTFAANETTENTPTTNEAVTTTTSEEDHDHSEEVTDSETTTQSDQHNGNYFETGDAITIDKVINGNVVVVGNTVTITGQIYGDLFVFANESLDIQNGAGVAGNVFALSPSITLNGLIYNLYAMTDTFKAGYDALIALDLKILASNIEFAGYIERSVYFYASDTITLTKDAYILGNCTYSAPNIDINEEALIMGEKIESDFVASDLMPTTGAKVINYISSFITAITFTLVILLIILLAKPKFMENATTLSHKPLKTFGVGLLALILTPIIGILCYFFSALVPLGALLLAVYFLAMALSTIIVSILLAKTLDAKIQKTHSELSILVYVILVAAVLWALVQLPYVSIIVSLIITIFGLGIITTGLFSKVKLNKKEKVEKDNKTEAVIEEKQEEKQEEVKEDKPEEKKDDNKEE